MADCEQSIAQLEASIQEAEHKMSTPEGAADQQLYALYQSLKNALKAKETEWENASIELEENLNIN